MIFWRFELHAGFVTCSTTRSWRIIFEKWQLTESGFEFHRKFCCSHEPLFKGHFRWWLNFFMAIGTARPILRISQNELQKSVFENFHSLNPIWSFQNGHLVGNWSVALLFKRRFHSYFRAIIKFCLIIQIHWNIPYHALVEKNWKIYFITSMFSCKDEKYSFDRWLFCLLFKRRFHS